jgi:hypothetical protein
VAQKVICAGRRANYRARMNLRAKPQFDSEPQVSVRGHFADLLLADDGFDGAGLGGGLVWTLGQRWQVGEGGWSHEASIACGRMKKRVSACRFCEHPYTESIGRPVSYRPGYRLSRSSLSFERRGREPNPAEREDSKWPRRRIAQTAESLPYRGSIRFMFWWRSAFWPAPTRHGQWHCK